MCGITAAYGEPGAELVGGMMDRISHRGPDGRGSIRLGRSTLGHLRLAILDLPGGAQPMTNELGSLAVAFNGEIYNHRELRSGIEARHLFRTRSDTEVLLHLYEEEGEDMLDRLDGMFAIAMAGERGMLLARDPLGIKPLYYGRKGEVFLAASELKAFPSGMDDVAALPAGHAMRVGGRSWRYARRFPPEEPLADAPLPEILQELRRRLEGAVEKRFMSDVPVGVYLSGGLDSSLVAALMRPFTVDLHSFAAGMEGSADIEAARIVAKYLGTKHHELVYTAAEVEAALPEVIGQLESFDAPLVRSAVPMYFVSRLASEHVKVALSGEGADEVFAGYSYLSKFESGDELRRELAAITDRLQDTNLQRTDRMSMAHGLEARVPFLDQGLLRFACRIPSRLLLHRSGRPEKWLLREACRGLLPQEIIDRKKMKFSEGAGSSELMAAVASEAIGREEFEREREISPGLVLRSPEELYYYRLWKDAMPSGLSPSLVGRTRDRGAASA